MLIQRLFSKYFYKVEKDAKPKCVLNYQLVETSRAPTFSAYFFHPETWSMSSTVPDVIRVVCQLSCFHFQLQPQRGSISISPTSHLAALALRYICSMCMWMYVFYCRSASDEHWLPSCGNHSGTGGRQSIATRLYRLKLISQ